MKKKSVIREAMDPDKIRFKTPCPVSWDSMKGDNRVRFCDKCNRNVYMLSAMTRVEAMLFLEEAKGRECVGVYKRADGTVVTSDCGQKPEEICEESLLEGLSQTMGEPIGPEE